ncbi:helix-turn-helix domain-containing protein [bacterium]|nr:helix-turn-helix domain-containing protein [bacterium]MBU1599082.1 helix-turn-helix domain-containing protein [bacterium]MBU2462103.1 helix-turn-helix domain-containing protein [bacterium]
MIFKEAHRSTKEKRSADRVKAILFLDKGWNFYQVSEILFTDVNTIYQYLHTYQNKGLNSLLADNYKAVLAEEANFLKNRNLN